MINIKDFLEFVNSFEIGNSSLSADVLQEFESTRHNEPSITPHLKYSIMDKEFRMTKQGAVRTFEMRDTTATVIGSSVEFGRRFGAAEERRGNTQTARGVRALYGKGIVYFREKSRRFSYGSAYADSTV